MRSIDEKPISVLHVLGMMGSHRGGSASALVNIARSTSDAGDRATVLTTVDSEEPAHGQLPADIDIVTCPRQWPRHYSVSWPLAVWTIRHVRRFDLVEVHEVFAFPTMAVWLAARARGVPFVVRPHGSLEPYDVRKHARVKTLLRPGLRRMLRDAAAIWLTADREAANLAHLGTDLRTVVSPLPVPPSGHRGDPEEFRRRYGMAPTDRVVLFLGRLDPKKGIPRLVEAFESVRDHLVDARLVIVGTGATAYVESVHRRVEDSRHARSIRMIGFLDGQDRADAQAGADLFCLHSDNENFGIAPVEALQQGTPVVLSDEVYIAEDLRCAGAAVVVESYDVAGLAQALVRLLDDGGERGRLAANAVAAAELYAPGPAARRDAGIRRTILTAAAARGGRWRGTGASAP